MIGVSAVLMTIALAASTVSAARVTPLVHVIRIDGVIGPGMARYVRRALDETIRDRAEALVIEIDTPGGLMTSMDDITKAELNAPVATVAYVSPTGARAASAGVFVLYAANIAAMAPTTHLGAAHPVGVSSVGADKTMMTKITNDAAAEIRAIALRRGRNAAWAEQAVRQSVSITDTQAHRLHVVDLIAGTERELLAQIDGRRVVTVAGTHRLATRDAALAPIAMDASERFLQLLSDPNIGFVLMTIAIYGIIFELSNPGSVFPGVLGVLALILALASFAAIEVNVAGLLLIGFAIVLFIADIKVPSHGILTAGGIASFVIGSLLLTQNQAPFLRISLSLILITAALTAAFFLFAVGAGIRAQARAVRTGPQTLLGALGVARGELAPEGPVFVQGELWRARTSEEAIPAGRPIRVVGVRGLLLDVREAGQTRTEDLAKERTR
ncbi:MAG TPA: nodulation protein NfeD [Candidatus Limnocylindria bacterium]|nr:nodulation protein NfeD [Candidatus Limnocylindria bacterium]